MKSKLTLVITIGLLITISLTSCNRTRLRPQGGQPPSNEGNPPTATESNPLTTEAPASQAVSTTVPSPIQPTDTAGASAPAQPTNTTAALQPTSVQPAAVSPDISQAADDLSNLMDGLTKDLDTTDTMEDVK